jgi:hypothetical protein
LGRLDRTCFPIEGHDPPSPTDRLRQEDRDIASTTADFQNGHSRTDATFLDQSPGYTLNDRCLKLQAFYFELAVAKNVGDGLQAIETPSDIK